MGVKWGDEVPDQPANPGPQSWEDKFIGCLAAIILVLFLGLMALLIIRGLLELGIL